MMSIFSPPSSRTIVFTRAPAGPDARAHGVDLGVLGGDGDLRAVAGLAGERLDLDGAVGDLGDLELEEPPHELRARAGEDDLGSARRVLDLEEQAADAVAGLVLLARDLLLRGHDGLGLADVDVDVVALPAADRPGDDVADLVLEVVVDAVLLELPEPLHHGLAGRLGRDAAQRRGVDLLLDELADHGAGLHGLRLLDMDLRLGVADGIDHLHQRPGVQLAVLGIDVDLQLLAGVNPFLGSGLERIRDRRDHVRARNALLFLHVLQDGKNLAAHRLELWKKKAGPRAHFNLKVSVK